MATVVREVTNQIGEDVDAICDQEGNPLENIPISYQLVDANGTPIDTFDAITGELVTSKITTVYTNAVGKHTASLWPNDRGVTATQYLCIVGSAGTAPVKATLNEGDLSPVRWIDFIANGIPITPAELLVIYQHLANDSIHFEDTTEAVTPQMRVAGAWTPYTAPAAGTNNIGYLNLPYNSQSADYTTVLTDRAKCLYHPSTDATARQFSIAEVGTGGAKVPFTTGDTLTFQNENGAGVITIHSVTTVMRMVGSGATGDRTLAANGLATAILKPNGEWSISGTGLT